MRIIADPFKNWVYSVLVITILLILSLIISYGNALSKAENNTSDNQSTVATPVLVSIFGTIITAVSASVAYLTYRYQRKVAIATHHYQRKQYKLNALIQVFNLLSNEKHIKARDNIEKTYRVYVLQNQEQRDIGLFDQPDVKYDVELIKADFEQIGALVKNELIDKKTILDAYGLVIQKCWDYLEDHINATSNGDPKYMTNFRSMANDAKNYGSG